MADDETRSFFVLGPGSMVFHYRIVERIGAGGMGEVYLAEDTKLNRKVALKFLPAMYAHNAEFKARLLREARAAAAVDHPNVCAIYEVSEWKGFTFLAMPYLKGKTVRQHVTDGSLSLADTVDILVQAADGLRAAHKQGVVHRDIKSSNIIITDDNRVSILDFGLAKSASDGDMTRDGTTLGTVAYMSPEQVSGGTVDQQSDIWSLGVVAYEMITGVLPFKRDNDHATFNAIVSDEPPPMNDYGVAIPETLEKIVRRCLTKDKNQRYRSADQLLADLERLISEDNTRSLARIRPLTGSSRSHSTIAPTHVKHGRALIATAIWIVLSIAAVFLVDMVSESRGLSPALVGFVTVILFGLLPAILIGSYALTNRGLTRMRKWSIPAVVANVAVITVLMVGLYSTRELGSVTTQVSIQNEEGETITRVIPKNAFRKNVVLFFMENVSGDTSYTWLELGFTLMLRYDLAQDPYFDIRPAFNFMGRLRELGFPNGSGIPLPLERDLADEQNFRYFLTGAFTVDGDTLVLRPRLYETASGDLISEHEIRSVDPYVIVDSMSILLRHDLEIPRDPNLNVRDLPVEELTTSSKPALRELIAGEYDVIIHSNWEQSIARFEKAIELDTTFALAYTELQVLQAFANRSGEQEENIRKAMQYRYKLPERIQFQLRFRFLQAVQKDPDAAMTVLTNWAKLYPDDIDARLGLASIYMYRNDRHAAIHQYREVLRIDPGQSRYLETVGGLFMQLNMLDSALAYYSRYREQSPDRADAYLPIGNLYVQMGQFDKAEEEFSRAMSIDPEDVETALRLVEVSIKKGDFDEVERRIDNAMQMARVPQQLQSVYNTQAGFAELRGKIGEFFSITDRKLAEQEKYSPPLVMLFERMDALDRWVEIGLPDSAISQLRNLTSQLEPPSDQFGSMGQLSVYREMRDTAALLSTIPTAENVIETYRVDVLQPEVLRSKAIVEEERGRYDSAIALYNQILEGAPFSLSVRRSLARCYRMIGEFDKARNVINEALKIHPYAPKSLLEAALVAVADNDFTTARAHIDRLNEVWRDPDPSYRPAQEVRKLAASVNAHTTP